MVWGVTPCSCQLPDKEPREILWFFGERKLGPASQPHPPGVVMLGRLLLLQKRGVFCFLLLLQQVAAFPRRQGTGEVRNSLNTAFISSV